MRKVRRRRPGQNEPQGEVDRAAGDSGGLLRQVGQYESANGWPIGPVGIAIALVALVIVYPITRFVRLIARRPAPPPP